MRNSRLRIVPVGGLANRMRAIGAAYSLAKTLGKVLCVVWRSNNELKAQFSLIFKTDQLPFQLTEANAFEYRLQYECPRKKNFFISGLTAFITQKKLFYIDNTLSDRLVREIENHSGDVIINSGTDFYDFDPDLLPEIFKFTDKVVSAKHKILKEKKPQIAVQIRRTDNLNSIDRSPLSLFEQKIQDLISCDPSLEIFLATDDEQTKLYFSQLYPDNIIFNTTQASRTTPGGIIDAAAEFLIMSECKKIYGSYWSSFSEIAALYGNVPLEVLSLPQ